MTSSQKPPWLGYPNFNSIIVNNPNVPIAPRGNPMPGFGQIEWRPV
jgi:hypothetical protein